MKNTLHRTIFPIALVSALLCTAAEAKRHSLFIFRHVNVIPMSRDTVLTDYSVLVEDGRIRELGPSASTRTPAGATEIDANGNFMIPALSDMHVHLEGDAWNIMFPPGAKFTGEEINFADILFVYIANGITTVDVMFALPEHILLRERIKRNEIIGPKLVLSRMIDAEGMAWPPPLGVWIRNAGEAREAVTEIRRQGYDRVKVYSFLDKASYDTIMATGRELHMPVDGHIPLSTSPEYAISSGQDMIAHVEEIMKFAKNFTPEQVDYYVSLVAKSKTWVTSALILNRNLNALLIDSAGQFSKPGTDLLHPMASGIWKFVYQKRYRDIPETARRSMADGYNQFQKPFVLDFFRSGGKLLAGTDSPIPSTLPGVSLHEELEEFVALGLSPYEALRVATTNSHEFLDELDRAGTIEPGKIADLVLLDGNPLEYISNTRKIHGVMTQGRWIPKKLIDRRLREIRNSYARLAKEKVQ